MRNGCWSDRAASLRLLIPALILQYYDLGRYTRACKHCVNADIIAMASAHLVLILYHAS
jgi:hypothetical protein